MSSSWRDAPLDQTRQRAELLGANLGVTRVTEITWLDRIGIPVFASMRPDAIEGSLCVNAGKGFTREEARVGAMMEAIEFAAAENNRFNYPVFKFTPNAIVQQADFTAQFIDLCPVFDTTVDSTTPIEAVFATDMATDRTVAIPAELVFSPYPRLSGQSLFGTSTNGLCSGNTLQEAVLHGLCEVLERDVLAFNCVCNASRWVAQVELPETVGSLIRAVRNAGMDVALRYTRNCFRLPFFQAFILSDEGDPITISLGSGLHACAEIAAVRAITEAAQSRLSYIHGGRDDLTSRAEFFARRGPGSELVATKYLREQALDQARTIRFEDVTDVQCKTIDSGLSLLSDRLAENGMKQIFYFVLSPPEWELTVVKVVVPGLESFNQRLPRIGRRLSAFIEKSYQV